ncbi:hypothetical protein AMATHDRAFT_6785 [Amanita thiersii Skay4041]|uniref:Fungal-type protein kinase domain-containing protein n=1 Tax=Amanita thiersii Skay4041 TaxID=703135 RepID=A0A2A9N9U8_9AGAR|nr:hypothetical protein AMATHDRAFT_6785 [Amanita thiersii Skay4041]
MDPPSSSTSTRKRPPSQSPERSPMQIVPKSSTYDLTSEKSRDQRIRDMWLQVNEKFSWTNADVEALGRLNSKVTTKESQMYPIWIEVFQKFCVNAHLVNASTYPAPTYDGKEIKPDIYDALCGRDTTVEELSPDDPMSKRATAALNGELSVELPLYNVSLGEESLIYIIGHSCYMAIGTPTGRSTRGFSAFRIKDKRVVYLKDTWRIMSDSLLPEHKIYEKLYNMRVACIPNIGYARDILKPPYSDT